MSTHLAICPNCEGEMDVTDVGPYTRVRCPGCGEEVRVKTEMGGYRLVRRLAFGGMSVVFVARDPTLDREIAVKVLSEEYSADRKREKQFEREAKLTAAVSHPNVVRVFTVGRAFDRFFIAMELVTGQSLDERMSVHGALPEQELIELALQVVDGLRAAESAGLIHRDIKPGNILIDENGTAKIVDFGLSLLTEGGSVRADELWATPYYVPPETLEHADEDHRSDIYALGATLYHALAGVAPIDTMEMSTRVLREEKKKIAPLREVAPWLSSETIRTVERAMAYDRRKRFSNYDEFRISLEAALGVLEANGARYPVHGTVRAQRRERQRAHRKAWVAGGVLLVLVLATTTAFMVAKLTNPASAEEEAGDSAPIIALANDPTLDPETAREISEAYKGAREALAEDDFVVAEEQFLRVWTHEKAPAQTAAWAAFEATVAALLDGRSSDARAHLAALQIFLIEEREHDTQLGRRLLAAIELLTSLAYVPEDKVPLVLEDPFRATTFFAMALKTWEQGQLERASGMFARLEKAGPWPDAEWMETYQKLAARYVTDFSQLQRTDHEVAGKGRKALEEAIENLEELYTVLQTRGRARFNVKVWQNDLMRKLRELTSRRVAPQWRELRSEVAEQFAAADFEEAAMRLKAARLKGELEQNQRAALVNLCEAAEKFLSELQAALRPGASGVQVATKEGSQYGQILGSQDGGLLVEEDGAAKSLGWKVMDPQSLLQLHRNLIEATEEQERKEARLWEAASYAWLNGLHEEAEKIVNELIALEPAYAKEWDRVVEYLGEFHQ